jgi:hypothetical protein
MYRQLLRFYRLMVMLKQRPANVGRLLLRIFAKVSWVAIDC